MNQKVNIIIPTFNRKSFLINTLLSFNTQSYKNFEIIVVDDGSEYNLSEEISGLGLNYKIIYFYIDHHGRASARNYAIKNAAGEILLFFDDHSRPSPGLIEEHVKGHYKKKNHGALRGRIEYIKDFSESLNLMNIHFWHNLHRKIFQNNPIVAFGTHNLSVKREVISKIGGFDEIFNCYGGEDQEFGIRIKKAGYRIGYLPKAITYNIRIPKNNTEILTRAAESGKMAALLIKKHPDYKSQLGFHLLNRILIKNSKNYNLYKDFVTGIMDTEKVKNIKKLKFIIYYFSLQEALLG
ncbi:MAG: glycosyltransferase family 2 protein [Candidatus Jordarchaeum sp.]|uniref:glycosyltransferase family 2 protein n=1 Tax=Candidatus Jordarchaeum sp. TaxID=2823881 RepID=UPI00404AACAE